MFVQVQPVFWSVTLGSATLLWAESIVHPIIETIVDITSEVSPNMQEVLDERMQLLLIVYPVITHLHLAN